MKYFIRLYLEPSETMLRHSMICFIKTDISYVPTRGLVWLLWFQKMLIKLSKLSKSTLKLTLTSLMPHHLNYNYSPLTLSTTAISQLKRFITLPNGVTWKKYIDLFTIASNNWSCSFFLAWLPAYCPHGVEIIENIIENPDSKPYIPK